MFYLIMVVIIWLCITVRIHQTVNLKRVNLMYVNFSLINLTFKKSFLFISYLTDTENISKLLQLLYTIYSYYIQLLYTDFYWYPLIVQAVSRFLTRISELMFSKANLFSLSILDHSGNHSVYLMPKPATQSHGQRSLAGYSPWGHKELDRTETT